MATVGCGGCARCAHLPQTGDTAADGRAMERGGTWLCPTEADRERLIDMSARVKKARTITAASMGLALLAAAPWVGWLPLALLVPVAANLAVIESRLATAKRP